MKIFSKDQRGFTLVEIVVALGITMVVVLGIYKAYDNFFRHSSCQDVKLAAQQKARAANALMQKELLLTGFRVPVTADPIEAGLAADSITFRYFDKPSNRALKVTYSGASSVLSRDTCVVDTVTDDGSWNACVAGPGAGTIIDELSSLSIEYLDEDHQSTADETLVRFLKVTLEVEGIEACRGQSSPPKVSVSTEARLRNLI